jgi:transposase-like protein
VGERRARIVLVELGLVEQRLAAVKEVIDDGATVTDVARRYGVARQTVHEWLRRYAKGGLAALIDASSRPLSCPHQMSAVVEARIVELRRAHPGWRCTHDRSSAGPRWGGSAAGSLVDLPLSGPPWADHAAGAEAQAQ